MGFLFFYDTLAYNAIHFHKSFMKQSTSKTFRTNASKFQPNIFIQMFLNFLPKDHQMICYQTKQHFIITKG